MASRNHYISDKIFYNIKSGKSTSSFFIFPTFIFTNYKQNTWSSENKLILIGFFRYYIKISVTKINKIVDYDITSDVMETINLILTENNYYISDVNEINKYLSNNKNLILLLKNTPKSHKYLQKTILNIIKYNSFVKEKVNK